MNYSLCKKKQNGKYYLVLAISKGFKKGYGNQIGLGYWEDIKDKYGLSSIEELKEIARKIDTSLDKTSAKEEFFKLLVPISVKTSTENLGLVLISKVISELELFSNLSKPKQKDLEEVLEFVIATRMIFKRSEMSRYKRKNDFVIGKEAEQSSIYNYFDLISKNKDLILKRLFDKSQEVPNQSYNNINLSSKNICFESFEKKDLKTNGILNFEQTKDNIVNILIATRSNEIPFDYRIYEENNQNDQILNSFIKEIQTFYDYKNIETVLDNNENSRIESNQWDTKQNFKIFSSILSIRPIYAKNPKYIDTYIFLAFLSLVVLKYCFYKLLKYYENKGDNKKISLGMFLDSIQMISSIKKEINGQIVAEITNDLDEQNKEHINIFKDFPLSIKETNNKIK